MQHSSIFAQVPSYGPDAFPSQSSGNAPWLLRNYGEGNEPPKTLFLWNSTAEKKGGPASREEHLISDRPDFTEAGTTVGRGVTQVEMGYTYTHDAFGGSSMNGHSFPEMLWRIGMFAEWFELRIGYNSLGEVLINVPGQGRVSNFGSDDLYLGTKLGLTLQQGWLPETALIIQSTLPTGSDYFSAHRVLAGANYLFGWEITKRIELGGSSQVNSADENGATYTEFAQSITVGYELTEKLGGYTEFYGIIPHDAATAPTEYYFDGGLTYKFSNDLQFDIRAGVGLNERSSDYFVGSGFVKRW